jgi:hypothetical protein
MGPTSSRRCRAEEGDEQGSSRRRVVGATSRGPCRVKEHPGNSSSNSRRRNRDVEVGRYVYTRTRVEGGSTSGRRRGGKHTQ